MVESTFQPCSLSILYLKATNVLLCFKCNQQLTVTLRYILTSLDYSGNEGVWQKDAALPSFTYNHKTKQSCYRSARHLFLQQHSPKKRCTNTMQSEALFLVCKTDLWFGGHIGEGVQQLRFTLFCQLTLNIFTNLFYRTGNLDHIQPVGG